MAELRTDRLILRCWRSGDRAPFARLNADPQVMRHFPAPLSRPQSDALADQIDWRLARNGWGLWALERRGSGDFIGFTGLAPATFAAHFTPAVEIGWRLAREAWGRGYATEAALASARFAFQELGLDELVSFTAVANTRSQAVMRRLGMTHRSADDFAHPRFARSHPLRRHVLYRLRRPSPSRQGESKG